MNAISWIMDQERFKQSAYRNLSPDQLAEALLSNYRAIDGAINWSNYRAVFLESGGNPSRAFDYLIAKSKCRDVPPASDSGAQNFFKTISESVELNLQLSDWS